MKMNMTKELRRLIKKTSILVMPKSGAELEKYKRPVVGSDRHDLGHASKCPWELDKEA